MDSHVKETQIFDLYPGDTLKPLQVEVTVKTSNSANDGFLEAGRSVATVSGSVYKLSDNTDVTTDILYGTATELDNIITAYLNYPTINGAGDYGAKFIITLDNGSTRQINVPNIKAYE